MRKDNSKIQEELNDVAPFLAGLRNQKSGLEVPEGYFDRFEDNLMARIKAEEAAESWSTASSELNREKVSWWLYVKNWLLRPQVGVGFAMILIIAVAATIWTADEGVDDGLMAISSEEATEYIQNNIDQFSETFIIETADEEDLASIELSDEIEMDVDRYIEEDLIDELDSELIDELL